MNSLDAGGASFRREHENESDTSLIVHVFKKENLDAMNNDNRRYNLTTPISAVYISIDPSAANQSLYVIVSMFYPYLKGDNNRRYCVVSVFFIVLHIIQYHTISLLHNMQYQLTVYHCFGNHLYYQYIHLKKYRYIPY